MNFDPRLFVHDPGTALLPDMVVVAQELLNVGTPIDQIDPLMNDAANRIMDGNSASGSSMPVTAANVALMLGINGVEPPTEEQIAEAKAAIAAATQPQGGPKPMDEATQDAMLNSEMDRETHLALACYAMAKALNNLPSHMVDPSLQNEYQAHLNALDPNRFRF